VFPFSFILRNFNIFLLTSLMIHCFFNNDLEDRLFENTKEKKEWRGTKKNSGNYGATLTSNMWLLGFKRDLRIPKC
jgi:hypothetical protein